MRRVSHICLFLILFWACYLNAQVTLYRTFSQPSPTLTMFIGGIVETPVRTIDGGYLLTSKLEVAGFENPGGVADAYIIKTDSNFVPQWKKRYSGSLVLPTGGILLFGGSTIEKVTPSGSQVWIKNVTGNVRLSDAVSYGANVRFVGVVPTYSYVTATTLIAYINDGITLLVDSSGNYTSHQLFYSSVQNVYNPLNYVYRGTANFDKIKRDASGDFYVYSSGNSLLGNSSNMALAKFNSSFSLLWAKTWGQVGNRTLINDLDFLPNGRLFVSALTAGNNTNNYLYNAALLKLDALGNPIQQVYFQNKTKISPLCKLLNGHYVLNSFNQDSVFMFETDTAMSISWHKYRGRAKSVSGSVIKSGMLYTSLYYGINPVLISSSLNGNSCASYSVPYTTPTTSISLTNFSFTPVAHSVTLVTLNTNSISAQSYIDSCKCPVFIPGMQNNLCVGNSSTVTIQGTGNLSWYGSATGNDYLHNGPQHVFGSLTPTVFNVYAQDSVCGLSLNRSLISVSVHAVPVLTISPFNPTICIGGQVFVTASGASNYTWSHNNLNSGIQNLNPTVTTNYTVTGSVAPGCSDTKTLTVNVISPPIITVTGPSSICLGSTASFSASGAPLISWTGNLQSNVYTLSPTNPGNTVINAVGSIGSCNGYTQVTLTTYAIPSLTVNVSPSPLCVGQSAVIQASGASNYTWSTGASVASFSVVSPANTTVYTVTGANSTCTSSAIYSLSALPLPSVTLTASQPTVCANSAISFSAQGAASYTWNNAATGSSNTRTLQAGTHLVSVSGTGTNGCVQTQSLSVNAIALPTLSLSGPGSICLGAQAVYTVNGANTYTWQSGSQSNTYSLTTTVIGMSTISVLGNNGLCTSSLSSIQLQTYPIPNLQVIASPTTVCSGQSVSLSANGATTYTWSNGSTGSIITSVLNNNAQYTVTGSANNCLASTVISIPVSALPQLSIVATQTRVCENTPVILTAFGANTYLWNSSTAGQSLTLQPSAGTHMILLSGSNGTCSSTTVTTIQAIPYPSVSIIHTPSVFCSQQSVTLTAFGANSYSWSNGMNTASLVMLAQSNTVLSVIGTSSLCSSTQTTQVLVQASPTLVLTATQYSVCKGNTVQLNVSGASTYSWTNGVTGNQQQMLVQVSQSVQVKGYNALGCSDTAIVYIHALALPAVQLSSSQSTICAGESLTLQVTGANTYSWNVNQTPPMAVVNPISTVTYSVIGTDANGCSNTFSITQWVDACTALAEIGSGEDKLIVYPNPGNGRFVVEIQNQNLPSKMHVFNITGQCIYSIAMLENKVEINLSAFAAGIYFLQREGDASVMKLIKH